MEIDEVSSRIRKIFNIADRVNDHEMCVEEEIRRLSNGRDDCEPHGDIRDENAVHDIEVKPADSAFRKFLKLGCKICKIAGEK